MNALQALKKAHQARAIVRDTHSLRDYFEAEAVKGKAKMTVVAIESKYVPSQDKRDLPQGTEGAEGAGNLGFRTRFHLENGETVGTFSNAAHRFAEFFAVDVMNHEPDQTYIRIDVQGKIVVDISRESLDNNRTTWNFEMVDGEVTGFGNYVPDFSNVLQLSDGSFVDQLSGEVNDVPETELHTEAKAKPEKSKKHETVEAAE